MLTELAVAKPLPEYHAADISFIPAEGRYPDRALLGACTPRLLSRRQEHIKPLVEAYFAWVKEINPDTEKLVYGLVVSP